VVVGQLSLRKHTNNKGKSCLTFFYGAANDNPPIQDKIEHTVIGIFQNQEVVKFRKILFSHPNNWVVF